MAEGGRVEGREMEESGPACLVSEFSLWNARARAVLKGLWSEKNKEKVN